MADNILLLARKLVELDQRAEALAKERADTLAQYRKLIGEIRGTNGSTSDVVPVNFSLRNRIHSLLARSPGVPIGLDEIHSAVGHDQARRKVVWTLANMRRDGLIKHEGRGLWSWEPEETVEEDRDVDF